MSQRIRVVTYFAFTSVFDVGPYSSAPKIIAVQSDNIFITIAEKAEQIITRQTGPHIHTYLVIFRCMWRETEGQKEGFIVLYSRTNSLLTSSDSMNQMYLYKVHINII